jgi:hypothetical protein
MKTLALCIVAILLTTTTFSQKAKAGTDSTLRTYLTYSCSMHPDYVSNVESNCPVCNMSMNLSSKEQMKAGVVKLYTCPMHPNVICTKAGKCPACKMEMVEFKPEKKMKQG